MKHANPVALLAAFIGLFALFGPAWLLLKPNRLVAGQTFGAFMLSPPLPSLLLVTWLALGALSLVPLGKRGWFLALLTSLGLVWALLLVSWGTNELLFGSTSSTAPELARVSLQGGVWLTLLATYVGMFGALNEARGGLRQRVGMVAPGLVVALVLVASGALAQVGLAQELRSQGEDFAAEVLRHLALSGTSVLLASIIGLPAAVWAARSEGAARLVLPTASFLQTLPSLALFGLMLLPLARLGSSLTVGGALLFILCGAGVAAALLGLLKRVRALPARRALTFSALLVAALPLALLTVMVAVILNDLFVALFSFDFERLNLPPTLGAPLSSLGVRGIGTAPALIALTLYAFLPIVRNCYTGVREVPRAAVEAGRGMGMSPGQILRRVELPLALPLIVEGVRASAVLTIGITTVAFLIGAGGLGTFIERGIAQQVPDLVLLGALPIILLALLADALLRGLGRLLTPRGIRT